MDVVRVREVVTVWCLRAQCRGPQKKSLRGEEQRFPVGAKLIRFIIFLGTSQMFSLKEGGGVFSML